MTETNTTNGRLRWDQEGEKIYETGTSNGVLYTSKKEGGYNNGVPWNGLIAVKQSAEGSEPTDVYANNKVYLSMRSSEKFKGTIEAYTYPDEFMECDGSKEVANGLFVGQQNRNSFGLSYKTLIGNDIEGDAYGEKLHIIYGATVAPSSRDYSTVNDTPAAISFSWEFSTVPAEISPELEKLGLKPTAYVGINLSKLEKAQVASIKDLLWGSETAPAKLPTLTELVQIIDPTVLE